MNDVDPLDPDENKYYAFDWTSGLNTGATVTVSTWAGTGLTFSSQAIASPITRAKITGGTAGLNYTVTNTITTSDGELLERSGILRVRNSA